MKSLLVRLLLVMAAAVAPAVAFLAYSEIEAWQVRQQLVEQEALRLVRMVAAEQQRIAEGAEQVLDALASTPAVQDDRRPQCERILANLLHRAPRYSNIFVLGLDGIPRCSASPSNTLINASDRFYFREALRSGGFVVGEYSVGRINGQQTIHLAKPFVDAGGAVEGVIVLALDLRWLRQALASLALPPDSTVSISDRNGIVVAHLPDPPDYVGGPILDAIRFILQGGQVRVVEAIGRDGSPRMLAYSPPSVEPKGLAIAIGLNRRIALAAFTQANRTGLLLVVAGGLLAIMITALLGSHLIKRPFRRLLEVADRWRSGDLAARSGIRVDSSEFGRLAAAFDSVAASQEARVQKEVAAREAAQTRAAQSERLAALGQLAGGIAHDFNNVLQAIVGAASLIERRRKDEVAVRRLVRITLHSAERGASITRRLLAFGHRSNLQAEAVDANAVLANLRAVLVETLGAGIDVRMRPDADRPVLVADKGQLETALLNLATNARDAMPNGGALLLSLGTESVAEGKAHRAGLSAGQYVWISVADSGTGMDDGTLNRATEPFFTTKGVGVGTGLGLSVVKGFVEQSGGGMAIASTPGRGTTVTLWLPRAVGVPDVPSPALEDESVPDATASPAGQPARTTVLVVDDEDVIREMIAEHLEANGFAVLTARNGSEALACLGGNGTVDVLLTDLSMPGMDGLAVIRAAQARRPGLPAVLLTGYAEDDAALAIRGAVSGSFSLLRKPLRAAQLVERIRSLLPARTPGALPLDPAKGREAL